MATRRHAWLVVAGRLFRAAEPREGRRSAMADGTDGGVAAVRTGPLGQGAAVTLAAAAAAIAVFALVRPLDAPLAAWARQSAWAGAPAGLDYALRVGLLALAVGAALVTPAPLRALGGAAVVIASGNVLAEVLKTAIERARPSDVVGALGGNSLPSGHVLGCAVTAAVAIGLARRGAWPVVARRALAVPAVGAVLVEAGLRVARGSHWPSDAAVSVVLGVAWVLAARAAAPAGRRAVAGALACLGAVYLLFYCCPSLRLHVG